MTPRPGAGQGAVRTCLSPGGRMAVLGGYEEGWGPCPPTPNTPKHPRELRGLRTPSPPPAHPTPTPPHPGVAPAQRGQRSL